MKTKLLSLAFAGMLALAMIGGAVVYGAVTAETADASAEAEVHTAAPEAASADEAAGSLHGEDCPLSGHK